MLLYTAHGGLVQSLTPTTSDALFILDEDGTVEEVALKYRNGAAGSGRLVYDLPQFPELNGRSVPDSMSRTDCTSLPTSGPTE